ncbi:MAG: hypothetical protein N3A55_06410 [Methylohalobius sp.]|nr:hypothetical protein [Methylohalobius sp.]
MSTLPFAPQPQAVALWLEQLHAAPAKTRSRHLYAVLKTLNAMDLVNPVRLSLLEALRPSVFVASEVSALDSLHLADPQSERARNTAKLSAFLHHEMALGYVKILAAMAPLAGHRALTSLGWMLVRIMQLGEPVSASVWRRLYSIYRQGEDEGWLTLAVSEPLAGEVKETAQDRFKCALAFAALSPMRFKPQLMGKIFEFLLAHHQIIVLSHMPEPAGWFVDLLSTAGPRRQGKRTLDRCVYLSFKPSKVKTAASFWPRLQHHLGIPPSEANYPLTRRVDELWWGWESIVAELKRHQLRSASAKDWLTVPQFELAPLDSTPPSGQNSTARIRRRLDGLLQLSQSDTLAVLDIDNATIQPGDLVVLKLLDETLQAAAVRWIRTAESGIRLGLDLLGGSVEYFKAILVGRGPIEAIWINGGQERASAACFPPQLRLKPGESIVIGDREARVTRLLEWSDDFCAYALTYPQ